MTVQYVALLREANIGCTRNVAMLSSSEDVPMEKVVTQGDTISPKIFAMCLEVVIRELKWNGGIRINRGLLTYLIR